MLNTQIYLFLIWYIFAVFMEFTLIIQTYIINHSYVIKEKNHFLQLILLLLDVSLTEIILKFIAKPGLLIDSSWKTFIFKNHGKSRKNSKVVVVLPFSAMNTTEFRIPDFRRRTTFWQFYNRSVFHSPPLVCVYTTERQ